MVIEDERAFTGGLKAQEFQIKAVGRNYGLNQCCGVSLPYFCVASSLKKLTQRMSLLH